MKISVPYERTKGLWYVNVEKCVSCMKDHEGAEIVLRDQSVWFRCPNTRSVIYVREMKVTI